MILNSPYITGSITVTGNATIQGTLTVTGSLSGTASLALNSDLLQGTGSTGFTTTASFNAVSSSQQQISASLLTLTASYTALSSSYTALSGSYSVFSGSASTRITANSSSIQQVSSSQQQISSSQQQISASLLTLTASYTALSSSYTALSSSYNTFSGSASTRITTISSSQQNISSSQQQISSSLLRISSSYATTGSNSFRADQSITGSLTVTSTITAQTLVVQTVTSSILYSSGSNLFGNALSNTQTFTGSVNITGSQTLYGNLGVGGAASEKFAVTGPLGLQGFIRWSDGVTTSAFLGITGSTAFVHGNNFYLGLGANGSNNYAPTMMINNGKVGIGTTTPTSGSLQIFNSNGTNHIALNGGSYPNTYLGSFSGGTYFANNYYYASGHASDDATKRSMEFFMGQDEIDINTMPAGSPGTRTRLMTISGSQGYIGIGITTPQSKLHVSSTSNFTAILKVSDIITESTGIIALGDGGTSTINVGVWRAAANSMSSYGNFLNLGGYDGILFSTGTTGIGSQTERMRIGNTANQWDLMIGGTSVLQPSSGRASVSINGSSNSILSFGVGGSVKGYLYHGGTQMYIENSISGGALNVFSGGSGGVILNSGATSWISASDIRLKNINSNIENAIDKLSTLKAVNFSWKSDSTNKEVLGLIAQEVEAVFPQVVDINKLPSKPNIEQTDDTEYLGIRYTELIPVLVKAIQELQAQITELKNK